MLTSTASAALPRHETIARARRAVLQDGGSGDSGLLQTWIERSWQRCLAQGMRPEQRVAFDSVSTQAMRRTAEGNRELVQAARPVLAQLARTLAETRYFAILTNHEGTVIDAHGPIDRHDRRATLITRIGVDLSERGVGTTSIGAALAEQQPVWLHRGEHFFDDTSVYSCAGAPLFGPRGQCLGMLDLTGIEAMERPELQHLVARAARGIENLLLLRHPHQLLLRLNWPGLPLGESGDGLIVLDAEGLVIGANQAARQLLPELARLHDLHCRDLLALPTDMLFDAARRGEAPLEAPLWSGLRLQVQASANGPLRASSHVSGWGMSANPPAQPLREVETSLIRRAVEDAHGNVAQAARALGISRATVYRKLHMPRGGRGA